MSFTNVKDFVFGIIELQVDASQVFAQNDIVVVAAGYAQPGSTATGQRAMGIALDAVDSTGLAAGIATLRVETSFVKGGGRKIFWFKNDTGGGKLTQADVFTNPAYVKNNTTVTKTSTGASKAGTVAAYDSVNNLVGVIFDQIS